MSTDHVIKCGCCGSDTPDSLENKAYLDPDLGAPVCEECKWHLRNAQAIMTTVGIKGCYKE